MIIDERRAAQRVPAHLPVRYFYHAPDVQVPPTQTLDVSISGAQIQALDPFPQGASVAFLLSADDRNVLDVRAQVVHVERGEPPAPFRVGVRFTHLSDYDREILTRVIERVKNL
ncbi:MAG: PilZ domain-containing protein [Chloroflexi bacterium]|nr:PilZ domain-containing protein [Chloroflexota bacterium]